MSFKPVSKADAAVSGDIVHTTVKLTGDRAKKFKKMMSDCKLSGQQLVDQMVDHCLTDDGK